MPGEISKVDHLAKSDDVLLPTADRVKEALEELQKQAKQGQQQKKLIKFKMRQADQKDLERKKEQEKVVKEEEEARLKAMELQKIQTQEANAEAKAVAEKLKSEREDTKKRMFDEISEAKTAMEELDVKISQRLKTNEAKAAVAA